MYDNILHDHLCDIRLPTFETQVFSLITPTASVDYKEVNSVDRLVSKEPILALSFNISLRPCHGAL